MLLELAAIYTKQQFYLYMQIVLSMSDYCEVF